VDYFVPKCIASFWQILKLVRKFPWTNAEVCVVLCAYEVIVYVVVVVVYSVCSSSSSGV